MKISKQEKEVMELLEKRQLKIGAYRGFISNVSFNKVASSIHKIYKPLLEDKDKEIAGLKEGIKHLLKAIEILREGMLDNLD